jgi:choice-of-anchor C domain-containing protein
VQIPIDFVLSEQVLLVKDVPRKESPLNLGTGGLQMKTMAVKLLAVGLVLASSSAYASSNLVTNGSFEYASPGSLQPPDNSFSTIGVGSTAMAGWTVTNLNVDWIGSGFWQASDGSRSVDMNGDAGSGSLAQAINTVVGQSYLLTFDLSGNPAGSPNQKTLDVFANGAGQSFAFDATGMSWPTSATTMNYQHLSMTFIAASTVTTLAFQSTTPGCCYGPVLDNVSVVAVPEPETYAMLLAGLGLVGVASRRNTKFTKRKAATG